MALNSGNISLGFGLGLQAEPDNNGYNLAAQGIKMQEAEKARRAAAKAKADKDAEDEWQKYFSNIKVGPDIDHMYQNLAKETAAKHIVKLREAHDRQPADYPYNQPGTLESKSVFDTDMAVINNNSKALKQFDSLRVPFMQSGQYDVNQENLKLFDEARAKQDPSILERIKDKDGNPIIQGGAINPTTLGLAMFTPKPRDLQKEFLASNIKPVTVERGNQSPYGDYILTSDNKYVDVTASKDNLKALLEDPNWAIGKGYLERTGGDIEKAADLMFKAYGYKGVDSSKQGLKNKNLGIIGEEEFNNGLKTDVDIVGSQSPFKLKMPGGADFDFGFPQSQTTLKGFSPLVKKTTSVTKPIPKDAINIITGEPVGQEEVGVSKSLSYKDVTFVPINTKTGTRVDNTDIPDLTKKGLLKWTPMVPAVSTEKVDKWDGEGQRPQEDQYLVPVSVFTPTKEQWAAINQQEKELNAPRASSKSPRTVVKKQINKGTKQTRYTYSDGTTEVVNGIK
jgi:hypothetical protein